MTSLGANQLIHCGLATSYGIFVNTGSGNILVPKGTMLLPDPMMTNCPLDIQDLMTTSVPEAGGRLNIKMPSYQYRDSRAKDKDGLTDRLIFNMGIPIHMYLGKTVFILRRGPGIYNSDNKSHCTVSLIQRYLLLAPMSSYVNETLLKIWAFHSRKHIWKHCGQNGSHFVH